MRTIYFFFGNCNLNVSLCLHNSVDFVSFFLGVFNFIQMNYLGEKKNKIKNEIFHESCGILHINNSEKWKSFMQLAFWPTNNYTFHFNGN